MTKELKTEIESLLINAGYEFALNDILIIEDIEPFEVEPIDFDFEPIEFEELY